MSEPQFRGTWYVLPTPFADDQLHELMALADKGLRELNAAQRQVLGEVALKKK